LFLLAFSQDIFTERYEKMATWSYDDIEDPNQQEDNRDFQGPRKPRKQWIQCLANYKGKKCEGHVFKGNAIPSHCNRCATAFQMPEDVPFENVVPNRHLINIRGRSVDPPPAKGKGKGKGKAGDRQRQRTPPANKETPPNGRDRNARDPSQDGEKLLGELVAHVPIEVARSIVTEKMGF
jgi:hypothetical protein